LLQFLWNLADWRSSLYETKFSRNFRVKGHVTPGGSLPHRKYLCENRPTVVSVGGSGHICSAHNWKTCGEFDYSWIAVKACFKARANEFILLLFCDRLCLSTTVCRWLPAISIELRCKVYLHLRQERTAMSQWFMFLSYLAQVYDFSLCVVHFNDVDQHLLCLESLASFEDLIYYLLPSRLYSKCRLRTNAVPRARTHTPTYTHTLIAGCWESWQRSNTIAVIAVINIASVSQIFCSVLRRRCVFTGRDVYLFNVGRQKLISLFSYYWFHGITFSIYEWCHVHLVWHTHIAHSDLNDPTTFIFFVVATGSSDNCSQQTWSAEATVAPSASRSSIIVAFPAAPTCYGFTKYNISLIDSDDDWRLIALYRSTVIPSDGVSLISMFVSRLCWLLMCYMH
jgi:hypothetical protein